MSQRVSEEVPVPFHGTSAYFPELEWKLLQEWQKELYRNVMKEIHQALMALGPLIATTVFSLQAKDQAERHPTDNHLIDVSTSDLATNINEFHTIKIEENLHPHNPSDTEGTERIYGLGRGNEICLLPIKDERDTYCIGNQENERKESIRFSMGSQATQEEEECPSTSHVLASRATPTAPTPAPPGDGKGRQKGRNVTPGHSGTTPASASTAPIGSDGDAATVDPVIASVFSQIITAEEDSYLLQKREPNSSTVAYREGNSNSSSVNTKEPVACFDWRKSKIEQHKLHMKERLFFCSECKRSFTHKAALQCHQRIHTGEKPFNCTECNKRFALKKHLRYHQKFHMRVRPFPCTECEKSFIRKIDLKNHQRIHTGEKPFLCSVCGKSFTQKTHLLQHLPIHAGVKPFTCNVCKKSFTRNAYFQQHLRTHTQVNTSTCI
ncbi:zinc finger protein 398-like [Ambystoma mexicanum]|uniref:zinc finger protein 398-like n=1 Tax=Ambystoma mexicanum TaxID=8296 RepID=UPI0037E9878B